jgi:hypothetical protein
MTTEPMDVQDWQQDQINKLSPYEDDRAAEIEQRIRDQAYNAAEGAVGAANDAEEVLGEVITGVKELRKKITGGVVSPDDARRALAELRQQHTEIAAHVPSIKIAYEGAVKTIEDPAAKVAELTSKFRLRQ